MLNILVKEFKLLFWGDKTSVVKKILALIFTGLMLAIFVTIETYLFVMVIRKVKVYSGAAQIYLTLFLAIISCIMIVLNIVCAHKLFFNEKDIEQLTRYPISNEQIILSKLVFMIIIHFFTSMMFTYPLFLAYGTIMGRAPLYYFIVLFYPILSFLFEGGVALILVYPFKLLIDYLKKHLLVQFIVSLIVMFGACFLYSKILTLFMDLVVNNNINILFTLSSLDKLSKFVKSLIPINFLVQSFLATSGRIMQYLLISGGIFLVGITVSIFAFNYFRNMVVHHTSKELKETLKVTSIKKNLMKKELILLFKDSNNIFTFAGLLIVQPFLLYLVVSALNGVFSSGTFAYYLIALPYFMPVMDIVLIMLFTVIINSGANTYIGSEKSTMRIMKTIPVSVFTQLLIKVGVPFVCSSISLIISTLALLIGKVISFQTFIFGTLITIVLLLVFQLVSLKEELTIKMGKNKSTFLSSLYSYLLPIAFLGVSLVLSFFGLDIRIAYLISTGVIILLGVPFVINFKKKTINRFLDLEVVN
ncbi:MAG: hypothetical protein E7177_03540 [Erysipelotrichaceae bacterium]|nr:hypothetical protein [Erysipelotrichaceae bacterium]